MEVISLDSPDQQALVAALDRSLSAAGIVLVRIAGSGASEPALRRAQAAARAFFELPTEEKEKVRAPEAKGLLRGWVGYGSKLQRSGDEASPPPPPPPGGQLTPAGAAARVPDRKESFTAGVHEYCEPEARGPARWGAHAGYYSKEAADGHLFAANRWPEHHPVAQELRAAWRAYFESLEPLVRRVYSLMAAALQAPPATFETAHQRHFSEVRANHYIAAPPSASPPPDPPSAAAPPLPPLLSQQRHLSAHKDWSDFTILAPDPGVPHPHLAVAGRDDVIDRMVPYHGDCFTVLLGVPMQKWSNARWFAPKHCVEVQEAHGAQEAQEARLSLVYFRNPDYETVIAAPPAQGPRLYEDITSGEHWWGMYNDTVSAFGMEFKPSHVASVA